jgi:small subunit ribosomal protein S10
VSSDSEKTARKDKKKQSAVRQEKPVRFRLCSFDHRLLDQVSQKLVKIARDMGARVSGPIPLPVKVQKYTILRGPHVDKTSREQFESRTHKRLIDMYSLSPQATDALSKIDIPSGVEIDVKSM